ncbi:transglutaminase-like domain-containing protein [Erwinia mallotivora]|uniref:transglutaminase-like domain-containing protein n=1 Tax=Erwinia mallotivora TaxID=69222 RepID=UPI0035EBF030
MPIIKNTADCNAIYLKGRLCELNAGDIVRSKFGSHVAGASNTPDEMQFVNVTSKKTVSNDLLSDIKNVDMVNQSVKKLLPLGAYNQGVDLVMSHGKSLLTYEEKTNFICSNMDHKIMNFMKYAPYTAKNIVSQGTGVCDEFAVVSAAILAVKCPQKPVSIVSSYINDSDRTHAFAIVGDSRENNDVVVSDPWVIYPSAHLLSDNTLISKNDIFVNYTYPPQKRSDDNAFTFDKERKYTQQEERKEITSIQEINEEMPLIGYKKHPSNDVWHVLHSNNVGVEYVSKTDSHITQYSQPYLEKINSVIEDTIDFSGVKNGIFEK